MPPISRAPKGRSLEAAPVVRADPVELVTVIIPVRNEERAIRGA
jgi:hypothetical protein